MPSPREPTDGRPQPRLYLVTPAATDSAALAGALGSVDVAAVLLRLPQADERTLINRVKALAPLVQKSGAALVLDGHPGIVARAGADGAHLTGIAGFDDAVGTLKPDRIAGAGGLHTRHDAMLAAEHGADYVMFGEPDAQGARPAFAAILERVSWWAELFEVPCVAYAASLAEIAPLVEAGADFVALGEGIGRDPAALREAARRLAPSEPVP